MADTESGETVPAVKTGQNLMSVGELKDAFSEKDLVVLERALKADRDFMATQDTPGEIYFPEDGTRMGLNPTVLVYQRADWGAVEVCDDRPVNHPVSHVRFTHTGEGTSYCKKGEVCKDIVKDLQHDHMENQGCTNIKYNFLLSNDGTVYEGRGWFSDADRPPEFDHLKGDCVDIAYMGDFTVNGPPPPMLISAYNWIIYGEEHNYIQKRPQIIHIPNMNTDMQTDMEKTFNKYQEKMYS